MGIVYRARQLDLDRDVALKVIAPELLEDPQARDRFLSEARAAAAVEHPNVVSVHGAGIADGQPYLVMRYVAGDTLRTVVHRQGALTADEAATVATQLGDGLDAIHRAGYVHRDVKPQNVLLDEAGHAYLSDFGLAKDALATTGRTNSGQWVGTIDYVAPEQIRGQRVDARTDVYALGAVLYFMVTGHVPFERHGDEAKLWAHLTQDPPRPSTLRPELPAELDAVVEQALAKDPAQRQVSAGDLGRAARAAARGSPPGETRIAAERTNALPVTGARAADLPTTSGSRGDVVAATGRQRVRFRRAGAAVALIAIAGAAAYVATDRQPASVERPEASVAPAGTPPAADAGAEGPRVGRTIRRVGVRPRGLVVAAGDLWVISHSLPRVTRIDARSGRRQGAQPLVGRGASSIASHAGTIWVSVPARGEVVGVDARTGKVEARIEPPLPPVRVAAGPSGVWVVGRALSPASPDLLLRYDAAGEQLLPPVEFASGIGAITLGGGAVWVALVRKDRVLRLSTNAETQLGAQMTAPASSLAYGGGYVWASVEVDDAVARVHPVRGQAVTTSSARHPGQIAVAGDRVFVASNTAHTVVVFNPKTVRRTGTPLDVPLNPYGVATGEGHVWVTGVGTNTVTRIDY